MLIGTVVNPYLRPLELNLIQFAKKIEAGADFVQTQPIFDVEEFTTWLDAARQEGLADKTAILAGSAAPDQCRGGRETPRGSHGTADSRCPGGQTQSRRQRGRPGEGRLEALRRDHRQAQSPEGRPGHSHPLREAGRSSCRNCVRPPDCRVCMAHRLPKLVCSGRKST
jgi:hypothetical protein